MLRRQLQQARRKLFFGARSKRLLLLDAQPPFGRLAVRGSSLAFALASLALRLRAALLFLDPRALALRERLGLALRSPPRHGDTHRSVLCHANDVAACFRMPYEVVAR